MWFVDCSCMNQALYSLVPRPHPRGEEKGVWLQYDIPSDPRGA